jgi:hypothetical protein
MEIKKFSEFSVLQRVYEKNGDPVEQNTPTKTGIKYRDNINLPTEDTGDDSAGLYTIFLTQASSVISSMSDNVAPINPDKGTKASKDIAELIKNLKPTYESHKNLWSEIEKISDYVGGDWQNISKGELSSLHAFDPQGNVLGTFKQNMKNLDTRLKSKDITDSQYADEAKNLRIEANNNLDSSRSLYYMKIGEALDYYMQATKVFKQGALLCLQNMESEAKENPSSGKNYLNIITESAKNILGHN